MTLQRNAQGCASEEVKKGVAGRSFSRMPKVRELAEKTGSAKQEVQTKEIKPSSSAPAPAPLVSF